MKQTRNKNTQTNFSTFVDVSTCSTKEKSSKLGALYDVTLLNIKSEQECFEHTILKYNDDYCQHLLNKIYFLHNFDIY
jgi:hypothetical protein